MIIPYKSPICRPLLFLLSLLVLSGCARNPVTGKRQIVLISESQEIAYGREAHPEVLAQFGRVEDSDLQSYFNQIGQKLALLSHRPELEWYFNVVDTPVVNAFALPGGYIYFTREILAYMNNEAELAGVMGHEIGHVTARHSVSQISKAQLFGAGLGLGSVLSPTFSQLSDFAQVGVGMLSLKYGRDDERQSDELGVEYMSLGGYDPRELSKFFVVFQQMREDTDQSVPDWLSSHPAPPDRITSTRQEADIIVRGQPDKRWTVNRETFLRQISGIVYGENPREGFRSDGWFVHPDLRFRFQIPTGWRVQNSKKAVVAAPASQDAAIQLTLAEAPEGTAPGEYAQGLAEGSGVELVEGENTRINGNRAFIGTYRVQDSQGNRLTALAAFIDFEGRLYQILGLAPSQNFSRYDRTFEDSLTSFSRLTDRNLLNVQPDRLQIRTARRGQTLGQIAQAVNNPRMNPEALSRLNRIDVDQSLRAGTLVKVIEAGRR
jgi:predicted Zn-dependent protease